MSAFSYKQAWPSWGGADPWPYLKWRKFPLQEHVVHSQIHDCCSLHLAWETVGLSTWTSLLFFVMDSSWMGVKPHLSSCSGYPASVPMYSACNVHHSCSTYCKHVSWLFPKTLCVNPRKKIRSPSFIEQSIPSGRFESRAGIQSRMGLVVGDTY